MTHVSKEIGAFRTNKLALAVSLALTLGLAGCGDDKNVTTSVGTPNPNTLVPTGTIQGTLTDTVTNQPIAGAVVSIGVAQATTADNGQFVISNVPATAGTAGTTTVAASTYQVTVDLRQVKTAAGAAKYPDFSFTAAPVTFGTLNDGSDTTTGTSASNHATPVTGLVASLPITVGKLAAGISGVVTSAVTLKPVTKAGYKVNLVSILAPVAFPPPTTPVNAIVTSTGASEHVVGTVTTDATGAFSFANIESLRQYRIDVVSADGTERGSEPVAAPADGQVKMLLSNRNPAGADDVAAGDIRTVFVSTTDNLAPRVLGATPENNSDLSPANDIKVVFSFSEPILKNSYSTGLTATAAAPSLYNNVLVTFGGAKAGNTPHTLVWNDAMTELTVTLPKSSLAASSRYTVSIAAAAANLRDLNNPTLPVDFSNLANGGVVNFTTNGSPTPAKVEGLYVENAANLGLGAAGAQNDVLLNWPVASGASFYKVYRVATVNGSVFESKQLNANGVIDGMNPDTAANRIRTSDVTDPNVDFLTGFDQKITYGYVVHAVNGDLVESADSNTVTVQDVIAPAGVGISLAQGSTTATVNFPEPMDKVSARTLANYKLTATAVADGGPLTAPALPALVSIDYSGTTATLNFASGLPAGSTLTVTGVKDVAGKEMLTKNAAGTATNTRSIAKVQAPFVTIGFVSFGSDVTEASAKVATYVLGVKSTKVDANKVLPTLKVSYDEGTNTATLSYDTTAVLAAGKTYYDTTDLTVTVSGVKDAQGNAVDTGVSN